MAANFKTDALLMHIYFRLVVRVEAAILLSKAIVPKI